MIRPAVLALALVAAASATPTHIVGTLRNADQSVPTGFVVLTYRTFVTGDRAIAPSTSTLQLQIVKGKLDVWLEPGGPYRIRWGTATSGTDTAAIMVPESSATLDLADCIDLGAAATAPCPASSPGDVNFADSETLTGTLNGTNAVFALAHAPQPVASMQLFRNGILMTRFVDFTISGSAVTFVSGQIPAAGDHLTAWYRY